MSDRRSFFARLGIAIAAVATSMFAQKAIMQNGQAVVCDSEAVKCPLGHATCKSINAPIAVGNDSYQNPDVEQLRDFHVLRCEACHILFTRE